MAMWECAARLSRRRARLNDFAPFQHDGDEARAVDQLDRQATVERRPRGALRPRVQRIHGVGGGGALPAALKAIATADPTAPGIDAPMSGNIFQNSAYRWSLEVTNSKPAQQASFDRRGLVARSRREVVSQRAPLSRFRTDIRPAQSHLHPMAESSELRSVLAEDDPLSRISSPASIFRC